MTNLETGKAEYHPIMDYRKEMDYICASASLPMLAQIQEIDGKKYMDGGIADSIPFLEAKKNAIKCVVVLTKPKGYLCEKQNPLLFKALQLKYRKYPNFLKVLEHRHISYNRTVKLLERDPNVFIIRPSQPLAIDRLEKDKTKLEKLYQLGYNDALAVRDSLLKFINKNGI
ncbi:MAG TPA: patatin-like phospholipase family protein [Candidatus Pelethenecus sp.]|nr:patatin-like phospholipase family protein [Candidatus Pelethenecus sp.]